MLAHPIHGSIIYLSAETKGIKKKSEERVTQILMKISGLKKQLREGQNRQQIKEEMRKCKQQLRIIKQQIQIEDQKQRDIYRECSKYLDHIISQSGLECKNESERKENQNKEVRSSLNQQLLHFLLFRKKFLSASKFLKNIQQDNHSILVLAEYRFTIKFFKILEQLLVNQLDDLSQWVHEHSNFLKKNGCKLQFKLIVCKFIKILNTEGEASALTYLRTASSQVDLSQQQKSEIQKLTFALLQNQNSKPSPELQEVDLKKIYVQAENLFDIFKQEPAQPEQIVQSLPIIDPSSNSEEIGRLTETLTERTLALIQLIQRFGAQGRQDFLETLTNNERIGLQLRAAITQMRRNTAQRENEGREEQMMELNLEEEREMEEGPVNVQAQTENEEREIEVQVNIGSENEEERLSMEVEVGSREGEMVELEIKKQEEKKEQKESKQIQSQTQLNQQQSEHPKETQEEQYPQDFEKYDPEIFESQPTQIPSLPQQSSNLHQLLNENKGIILNRNGIVKHLKGLYEAFLEAFSQIYRVPTQILMDKIVGMGIMALKTQCCHQSICKFSEKLASCPVCTKQITVVAKKVPIILHHQSSLICRINGSLMNHEDNYPLLLPNGQIYSESGLQSMKKKGKYKCLISGNFYRKEDCRKVYLI